MQLLLNLLIYGLGVAGGFLVFAGLAEGVRSGGCRLFLGRLPRDAEMPWQFWLMGIAAVIVIMLLQGSLMAICDAEGLACLKQP